MKAPISGWEVEWAESVEHEADGSIIPDTARYVVKDFATKAAAVKFAKKIVSKDVFGSVSIAPFHLEVYEADLPAGWREYDADAEYVEAPANNSASFCCGGTS